MSTLKYSESHHELAEASFHYLDHIWVCKHCFTLRIRGLEDKVKRLRYNCQFLYFAQNFTLPEKKKLQEDDGCQTELLVIVS